MALSKLRAFVGRTLQRLVGTDIPLDKVLFGSQGGGRTTNQWAYDMDDPALPSLPIARWPHVLLLEDHQRLGDAVFDDAHFFDTAYFRNAWRCIEAYHHFTWCRNREQIREAARWFVARFRDEHVIEAGDTRAATSHPGAPVIVRRVRDSDYLQACDGHHRLAIAYARGQKTIRGHINPWPRVHTPAQQYLLEVDRHRGRRQCLQPVIECPEVSGWPVMRRCVDRLGMMRACLDTSGLGGENGRTFLDVECGFGWFVREMASLGYDATGIESNRPCCEIGWHVYGLSRDQLRRACAAELLRTESRVYDVTACLGVLQHYLVNFRPVTAQQMLALLDQRTRQVLFFETVEAHETWAGETFSRWTPEYVAQWVREHSNFTKVTALGRDEDNRPPFAGRFGRTLFACTRD